MKKLVLFPLLGLFLGGCATFQSGYKGDVYVLNPQGKVVKHYRITQSQPGKISVIENKDGTVTIQGDTLTPSLLREIIEAYSLKELNNKGGSR